MMKPQSNKSLADEKADIKRGLKTSFQEGAVWQPIAISWFEKWKTYVNYDDEVPEPRNKDIIDSLHPGELDNSSLQGSFGDEMRRDAVEGRDYVLLPNHYANMLFDKYGGSPAFPRKVLNVGQYYNPIYQVNLWPIRIEVYICDRNQPVPVQSEDRFKRRYFNKNMKLDEVADDLFRLFNISRHSVQTRNWLRDTPPDTSAEAKQGTSRMLTCDVVDFDGDWRFVRADANRNIQEVLGERDCIELIIEVAPLRNPKDSDWPRFRQLEAWKQDLRVGDMVDVKDRKGKFFAAKILSIDDQGNLMVHFYGWTEASDEKILATEINYRVAPLHGHSFDRSKWEEGNKVDVCLTDITNPAITPVWVTGTIIGTDPKADKVEVMVEPKDKAEAVKKSTSTAVALRTSSTGTSTYNDIDEDDDDFAVNDDFLKKKLQQQQQASSALAPLNAAARSSTDSITTGLGEVNTADTQDSTTAAVTTVTAVVAADETTRLWLDIYGDAIAPQYTHTPALRNTASTYNGSYGYGTSSLYSPYNNSYSSYERHTKGTPPVAGAVGLQNLGNTCFMNSILQCLSNTQPLTEMFTSGEYRDQINYDNPLGHSGKIALTYGKLVKDMWSGAYTKVVPREFKTVIGDYRPQFAGYEQQDSQEMMSCLLDGLHEDLNRIKKKPYTQKIESKGRADELIASESWRRFLLRNDSLIVERFFGLQKSHVTCRSCGKESVTFDPYATLSLPIPIRNTRMVTVIAQLLPHHTAPLRLQLEVELTATMSDMKKLLVDKLISMKLLSDAVVAPAAAASTPRPATADTSNNTSSVQTTTTDESFELVQRSEAEQMVLVDSANIEAKTEDSETSSSLGSKRKSDESNDVKDAARGASNTHPAAVSQGNHHTSHQTQAGSKYDGYHFHFGVLYSTRATTVSKNFNGQDAHAKNTAITGFVNKLDYLVAFQLEYPVADFKAIHSNYYYAPTITTISSTTNKKKNLLDDDDEDAETGDAKTAADKKPLAYFGLDIVIGTREGMRLELLGYPRRLSFIEGQTTNADVHAVVRKMLRRLIPQSSPLWQQDERSWPYELLVTSSYGSQVYRTVEKDSADQVSLPFVPLKENMEILVVHFHNAAVKEGLVDMSKARELIDPLLTSTSNHHNNNYSMNDIDDDLDDDEFYPATSYKTSKNVNTNNNNDNDSSANKRAKKSLTIYDCLDKYIEREQLADSETVYCNRCKEMLAPIKKLDVWSAPDILILHLKRFQFITGQYMVLREKINDVVDFPIEGLDMSSYVQGQHAGLQEAPAIYDLFAVSHHMGGLGGGHYTATAKNFLDNRWYYFNDSQVTPTDPASAINATAYVLFYKRRTGALKWAGQMPHPEGFPDEADD